MVTHRQGLYPTPFFLRPNAIVNDDLTSVRLVGKKTNLICCTVQCQFTGVYTTTPVQATKISLFCLFCQLLSCPVCKIWDYDSNIDKICLRTLLFFGQARMNSKVCLKYLMSLSIMWVNFCHTYFTLPPLLLLQLAVALHLSSSMELWTIKLQLKGQRVTTIAVMGLPWRKG